MTEDQIECAVSRKVDRLDARFMRSAMTQAEYDTAIKEIGAWADAQYGFTCKGCGRPEGEYSVNPCADVIADREA